MGAGAGVPAWVVDSGGMLMGGCLLLLRKARTIVVAFRRRCWSNGRESLRIASA